MAVDPVKGMKRNPQTLIQYTYCLNNPFKYIDPLGKFYEDTKLELNDGTKKLNTEISQDVFTLQLRLQSLKLLDWTFKNYGKFDEITEKAVNAYKDNPFRQLLNTGE
jgi:hypothetical protein